MTRLALPRRFLDQGHDSDQAPHRPGSRRLRHRDRRRLGDDAVDRGDAWLPGRTWRAVVRAPALAGLPPLARSEEHTSELQSLMRISYAVFCLKKKNNTSTKRSKLIK